MTEQRRTLTFVAAAVWTIGVALLLDVAVVITEGVRPGALTDLVNVTACHVLSYSIAVFAMLRVYEPETPVRDVVAIRPPPIGMLVLAAAIAACVYPALNALDTLLERRFPLSDEELEALGKLMTATSGGRRAFLAVSLMLLMPAAEEVFFRGVLFGGLRAGNKASDAILATALYFAAARADVRSFASALALGLVLGWLRDRSGSILTTIVAQAAFFAVPLIPILRGRDPTADEVYPRAWIAGGLAIAVVAGLVVEVWWRRAGGDADDDG